jgi:hypothetical protein
MPQIANARFMAGTMGKWTASVKHFADPFYDKVGLS